MPKRGTRLADIATMAARWSAIVLVASAVAHLGRPDGAVSTALPYVGAAVFMWAADLATLPIALIPVCGERYRRIILTAGREGGIPEAAQYILGLIGVLLALHQLWMLVLLVVPIGLVHLAFKKEMDSDTFQLLQDMADHIDLRGSYTKGHSGRVQELVAGILDQLGMDGQEARQIITAARLHDIGKIGLPDQLLINSGALSPEEQSLVESYPGQGAELMKAYPDFSRGLEMVRHHHERWDGAGYPDRLAGTDIPFGARVIAVADSFDAMTSERPYRRALSVEQAAQILRNSAGRQWDPSIVTAFLTSIGQHTDGARATTAAVTERQSESVLPVRVMSH
jgi:HD-GYP domain-containing protein (c-di-GMP phosphodiesterase class II)